MEGEIMDVGFNAFEVFEIAEKIERNGAKFYRKAAELFDDSSTRSFFHELADWEVGHEKIFAGMRKQLSEQSRQLRTFKPEDNLLLDAQDMAGLAVFGNKTEASGDFSGKQSKEDILRIAIEKEKDSIVYYTGLKNFIPDRAGKDKIDDIIKEEMHHIRVLNQSLKQRQHQESKVGE
jgi:rubrerythrin